MIRRSRIRANDTPPMNDAEFEREFWGNCINTYGEETKQLKYLELMGFRRKVSWRTEYAFDGGGRAIVDIGGGPCSVLLKFENLSGAAVVDPAALPDWAAARYAAAGINWMKLAGECLTTPATFRFDIALIYNCLQHVEDPTQVIERAMAAAYGLRMFEWIDIPPHPGHPHMLTQTKLEEWTGRPGRVVQLNGEYECTGRAWVLDG
jgi:hypothetical protein